MSCPVCGGDSAPNGFKGDDRCGPCHNFGLLALEGSKATIGGLPLVMLLTSLTQRAGTYDSTYHRWLRRLYDIAIAQMPRPDDRTGQSTRLLLPTKLLPRERSDPSEGHETDLSRVTVGASAPYPGRDTQTLPALETKEQPCGYSRR